MHVSKVPGLGKGEEGIRRALEVLASQSVQHCLDKVINGSYSSARSLKALSAGFGLRRGFKLRYFDHSRPSPIEHIQ